MKIKPASWGLALVMTITLGAFSPGALAQIVSNGGFEMPLVAPGSANYTNGQSFGGWTVDSGSVSLNSSCPLGGLQRVFLFGTGTIHQDLNTIVGARYTLSYARTCEYGCESGCDAVGHGVFVAWGPETIFDYHTGGWAPTSYMFVATGVTTRLSFTSYKGISLDDVTVVPTAPPSLLPLLPGKWPAGPRGNATDVKVVGKYAYVAVREAGLAVIDVSDPTNCVRVGGYETSGRVFGVAVSGNYAYVADEGAGLQVIDVSNPTNCARVGGYDTSGYAWDVAVSGNYAYVADHFAGLQVIDVSDPANCVRVGGYPSSEGAYGVAMSGNYAYVAGGDILAGGDGVGGLEVIDVSDPANCVRVGGYFSHGRAFGVAVSGNYAYVANSRAGLHVIDVSNPTNCVRVGGYDTSVGAYSVAVSGNYAYVADTDAGLQVIDVSNPTNCVRVGSYATSGYAWGLAVVAGRIYVAYGEAGLVVLPTLANVQFTVRVDATPGVPFTLEAATNLNPPIRWTPLLTTNLSGMPFDYVDFDVKLSEKSQKYYRVRQP